MKKSRKKLYSLSVIALLVSSCIDEKFEPIGILPQPIKFSENIQPGAVDIAATNEDLPPYATRSLISAQTTRQIQSQFLRIDEILDTKNDGTYTFPAWNSGYLSEASIVSSPSNEGQGYMRSVLLNPIQTYKYYAKRDDSNNIVEAESKFHHTRMISWYPITCPLTKNDKGEASLTKFDHFTEANVGYNGYSINSEGKVMINFRNLDGDTDIMVSEVREGQYWHSPGNGHPSDFMPGDNTQSGSSIYRQPFGRNETNPTYSNCFQYKHYLSAIKIYAYADKSAQDAAMWGRITNVVVKNQPKSCSVTIPELSVTNLVSVPSTESRTYGSPVFSTTDLTTFKLNKGALYGDDTNADQLEIAPDNPTLDGTSKTNKIYLGYALVAPNQDVVLDIHTDAGVFSIKIEWQQKKVSEDGKVTTTTDILNSGYVYNINLNFGTGGTIAAILLNDSEGTFFDLSTGDTYGASADGSGGMYTYKTANSYIVDPSLQYEDPKTKTKKPYDGFTFLATTIGNGENGLFPDFPHTASKISPVTAGLVWESKLGLVTQVEYMYNYVRFKVQPNDKGNAVIGVYDQDNKLLWSWHIWITDEPNVVKCTIDGKTVGILDRNLGATTTAINDVNSYGLYYQWGRKDPSMGAPEANYRPLSTKTAVYYDYYGNEHNSAEVVTREQPTIMDGVENPMYLLLPTSIPPFYAYDWLYHRTNTLWGEDNNSQKSIYDPCPFGYKVPGDELKTFFNDNKTSIKINGNAFQYTSGPTSLNFPLAGYKGVDRGISSLSAAWKYVGEKGDYMSKNLYTYVENGSTLYNNHRDRIYLSKVKDWTETGAANDNKGHGSQEHKYSGNIIFDFANRRTAASVRCITDDILENLGKLDFTLDGPYYIWLGTKANLAWGAKATGSKLTRIYLSEKVNNGNFEILEDIQPQNTNIYSNWMLLPGSNPNSYGEIGNYTYSVTTTTKRGMTKTSDPKEIPVINVTELYDVTLGGQSPDAKFAKKTPQNLSFKINMKELGEAGQTTTTAENAKLLDKFVFVNDINVTCDANGTFTSQVPMNGDITIEVKEPATYGGKILKRYVMKMGYQLEEAFSGNETPNINGTYFTAALSTDNIKYWWHTGENTNKKITPDNNNDKMQLQIKDLAVIETRESGIKIIDPHHVFQYEEGNKIKIMYNEKYLGDYFGAVDTPYEFYFDPGYYFGGKGPNGIGITTYYPINVLSGTEYLNWMYEWGFTRYNAVTGEFHKGTKWNVFKVENKITYTNPIEETVQP